MTLGLNEELCPVSLELLGSIYRADAEQFEDLMDEMSELTRAKLAIYLYGRSHTHELGLRVAAGCDGATLRRSGGLLGNAVYEQSRQPHTRPTYGEHRLTARAKISLGGSRATSLRNAI